VGGRGIRRQQHFDLINVNSIKTFLWLFANEVLVKSAVVLPFLVMEHLKLTTNVKLGQKFSTEIFNTPWFK
jgi:hypothetical protein